MKNTNWLIKLILERTRLGREIWMKVKSYRKLALVAVFLLIS
jgi:hypothetical protein